MDIHPLETHYYAVFSNVAAFLRPSEIDTMSSISASSRGLTKKMANDEGFWRRHFSLMIGQSIPPEQQPGKDVVATEVVRLRRARRYGLTTQ